MLSYALRAILLVIIACQGQALYIAPFPKHYRDLQPRNASTIPPPQRDPFYRAPAGFEATHPGAILRHRRVTPISIAASAYELLFHSINSVGKSNAVVTTVLVPGNATYHNLLSVQEQHDASDVDCSPSYIFQTDGQNNTDPAGIMIEYALRNGWHVNLPDFEGFDAAFTNGVQAGHAVLDSVRAVLHSKNSTGLHTHATTVLAGYSGGGEATAWAAELQPTYAPDLHLAGASAGGLTPNITNVLFATSGTLYAGLGPAGLLGLSAQFPDFRRYLEENLKPENASTFNQALTQCLNPVIALFAYQDTLRYFKQGVDTITAPLPTYYAETYGDLGHATPRIPIYAYKGAQDHISVISDTDELIAKYCAAGASVQYVRNSTTDHFSEEFAGEAGALAWIKDRMENVPALAGCRIETV